MVFQNVVRNVGAIESNLLQIVAIPENYITKSGNAAWDGYLFQKASVFISLTELGISTVFRSGQLQRKCTERTVN